MDTSFYNVLLECYEINSLLNILEMYCKENVEHKKEIICIYDFVKIIKTKQLILTEELDKAVTDNSCIEL